MIDLRTSDDLHNLRESVALECKLAAGRDGQGSVPDDFWPTYSAFANTRGGVILLGVREKKGQFSIEGISNPAKVRKELFDGLNNPQKVSANLLNDAAVQEITFEGRTIFVVEVPRAMRKQRPVYLTGNPFAGHTYRRLNEGDRTLSDEMVRDMLAEQVRDSRDAEILEHFTLKDLDEESLKAYRNIFRADKPDHPWLTLPDQEFLRMLGGWKTDRASGASGLTVAGLLLFGKGPAIVEARPFYFLDYQEQAEDTSETRWLDRVIPDGTWSGNVFDFYRRVVKKLTADLKVPFAVKDSVRQDDTPTHQAIREALVNTLIHADYTGRISIRIVKKPAGFEFRNPGGLRVPAEMALRGGVSDCRNPTMQQMFLMIGLGERAGSGLPKIIHGWQKAGHDLRLYEVSGAKWDYSVTEMLWATPKESGGDDSQNNKGADASGVSGDANGGVSGDVNGGANGGANGGVKLDILDTSILSLIQKNQGITIEELATATEKSRRTIENRIKKLKTTHIRRVGSDKTGHWEIIER